MSESRDAGGERDGDGDGAPGPVFLRGERVALHTFDEADRDFLRRLLGDPAVRRELHHRQPMNGVAAEEFAEQFEDDGRHAFTVGVEDERVGLIFLNRIDHDRGTAWPSVLTAPEHRGEGYATDALRTLVRWAFEELRLAKLSVEVEDGNGAGRRVLERAGFDHEGVLREEQFVDGERVDVHRYGFVGEEWNDE